MEFARNIAQFTPRGIVVDVQASEVPEDFWTGTADTELRRGFHRRVLGGTYRYNTPTDPFWHVNVQAANINYWLHVSGSAVYQTDGATETNISPTGYVTPTLGIDTVSGTRLNGLPAVVSGDGKPWYWLPPAPNAAYFPNGVGDFWQNRRCRALEAFKFHLFYANTSGDTDTGETQVGWSQASSSLPTDNANWTPTPENDAGFVYLADTPGPVIDMKAMRSSLILAKNQSLYACQYIAGQEVFGFRLLDSQQGALSPHAMATARGACYILSDGDILRTDGLGIESIGKEFIKGVLFDNINSEYAARAFAVHYPGPGEVWFCVPVGAAQYPNVAAVYDLDSGRWSARNLARPGAQLDEGISWLALGVIADDITGTTIGDLPGTIGALTGPIGGSQVSLQEQGLLASQRTGTSTGRYVLLDQGQVWPSGETITGRLEKHDITLGEPDMVKSVRAVHINAQAEGTGATIRCRIGRRFSESGPIQWVDDKTIGVGNAQRIPVRCTGRFISVEFTFEQPTQMAGFSLEWREAGRR